MLIEIIGNGVVYMMNLFKVYIFWKLHSEDITVGIERWIGLQLETRVQRASWSSMRVTVSWKLQES